MSGSLQRLVIPAFPAYASIPVTFTVNTGPATLVTIQDFNVTVFGVTHNEQFSVKLASFPYVVGAAAAFDTGTVIAAQGMKNIPLQFYLEEDSPVPVTNVSVSYTPASPLSGVNQGTIISAIPAFGSVPVTFLVSITGNESSFYQNLTVNYNGTSHNIEFKVMVPGYSNISLVNYYTTPPFIYQGEQFVLLKVALINGGNSISPPLNVSATSSAFSVSTTPYHLPGLYSGQLLNLTFLLNASMETGPADIYIHINSRTLTLTETILNKGSVELTSGPISVNSGTNANLFEFTAKNNGNVTLMDLNFHILTPDVFYIDVPS